MNRFKKTVGVVAVCSMLASCETMELSPEDKAAWGGIIGAMFPQILGVDGWQGVALSIAMGYAGYKIGKHLGREDQAALQQEAARALSDTRDGEMVKWASDEGAATAKIVPKNTRTETKDINIIRVQHVKSPRAMSIIGRPYKSTGDDVNLRPGPSTRGEPIGSLNRNAVVHAFGKVNGQTVQHASGKVSAQWVLIGRNDIALGYVSDLYVSEDQESAEEQQPVLAGVFELDRVDLNKVQNEVEGIFEIDDSHKLKQSDEAVATFELDDLVLVGDNVKVATDCRTLTIEIVVDDKTDTEETQACRGPNGFWEAA